VTATSRRTAVALSTIFLLLFMQTLGYLAGTAADATSSIADLRALGGSPLLHAGAALLLLLVATVLSVYKPRGMTRYGQCQQHQQRTGSQRIGSR